MTKRLPREDVEGTSVELTQNSTRHTVYDSLI